MHSEEAFWAAYSATVPIFAGFVVLALTLLVARLDADSRAAASLGVSLTRDDTQMMHLPLIVAILAMSLPAAVLVLARSSDRGTFFVIVWLTMLAACRCIYQIVWYWRRLQARARVMTACSLALALMLFSLAAGASLRWTWLPPFLTMPRLAVGLVFAGMLITASVWTTNAFRSSVFPATSSLIKEMKSETALLRVQFDVYQSVFEKKKLDKKTSFHFLAIKQLFDYVVSFKVDRREFSIPELQERQQSVARLRDLMLNHSALMER